ncbi:GNAT family N-acetyltransferase [Streptomyces sp. ISL-99]|uniref:GNAT family N-acetyltransferase n=1 Tax=Streptomyces sp. ISL-99 TaxID=2819193 RepID=UPI001BEB40DF|nr:GNAT family protein [Streptomyces sp. ISL-99]MBT2525424.1 GNAT family N-acetyltransferase [Streptomyces sp. ISL-99]
MHPVVRTRSRLALRELTDDDVDAIHAIYGNHQVTEYLSFEPRTRNQVADLVARSIAVATATPREEYALAVTEGPAGPLIGFARLALDPHQQQAATIGGALRSDAWGHGYGTEAAHILLDLAFDDLDLHRVWAARAPKNEASAKTLLAAGMTEEGRIRGHVFVRGAWRDSVVYGVLKEERNPART